MNMLDIKKAKGAKSKLVADYIDAKEAVRVAQEKADAIKKEIMHKMEFKGCRVLFCRDAFATIAPSPKVSVDVAKFKCMVSNDVFLQNVVVPVSAVRKLLSSSNCRDLLVVKEGTKLITGTVE